MLTSSKDYKVIRFEYSAIDKLFLITAENKRINRTIRIDVYNPTVEEMTNAIDYYTTSKNKFLSVMLACFGL